MTEDTIVGTIPNTKTLVYDCDHVTYCMPCFLCGDSMELTESEVCCMKMGKQIFPRVCDKCKRAWKAYRYKMIME